MKRLQHRTTAHAMTLLEAVLAMTIISIIAGILTPMLVAASDHYAAAANTRQSLEQSASAMDRIVRLLRENAAR
jgi:type II secretory pathway pseudopilin PulG